MNSEDLESARSYRANRTPIPEAAKRYRRGIAYEYKTAKYYRSFGYYVILSAGSRGLADGIAIGRNHSILFQAKSGTSRFTKEDRAAFVALPVPRNCIKELVEWKFPGKPPVITKLS